FTSFSGSLVSRIPGAVQPDYFAPFRAGCACGQHTSLLVIKITFSLSPATRVSNPFFAER
ncbi:hypothetical protein Q0Q88_10905, partial [Escherichia coli O74:H39]